MTEFEREILDLIEDVTIECPECECIGDDQYQCGTCGTTSSTIYVLQYLKNYPKILDKTEFNDYTCDEEILSRLKRVTIECPHCEDMYSDAQYTCDVCWCVGGQGHINIINWLKENKKLWQQNIK